jgi:hypothetical protein
MRRVFLTVVALSVLLPTTLVALFLTWFAVIGISSSLRDYTSGNLGSLLTILALLGFGWFGILTLWRCHKRLVSDQPSMTSAWPIWLGLACGSVVSVVLAYSLWQPTRPGLTIVAAWPLIGAFVHAVMLARGRGGGV